MNNSSNLQQEMADLFSAEQLTGNSASVAVEQIMPSLSTKPSPDPLYALPTNLPSALKHLDNEQLDRLIAAATSERQGRGVNKIFIKELPHETKRSERELVPLAQGKMNAIRASFKAGVKPNQIARQFGVSLASVRKVLATKTGD